MKLLNYLIFVALIIPFTTFGQAIVQTNLADEETPKVGCGSYEYMEYVDQKIPGFLESSNTTMSQIGEMIKNEISEKSTSDIYTIPVVFHVLHFSEESNLDDDVLEDQIEVLNRSFRRLNADTVELREEFHQIVGDSYIEFKLAEYDPAGNPTNGIVRKAIDISHFGGIIPYGPGQDALIEQWVQDSLLYNYFRMTNSELGGSDAWDESRYLNIWIGDMRILEPQFNNFEEMVYFALATPPLEHANWEGVTEEFEQFAQGVLVDYRVVGSNNPTLLPYPYHTYNARVKEGKMLVHEVGHYLGLRHIWGDVPNCSVDDFVYDTPNTTEDSQWNCNKNKNKCVDDIYGEDLPDMIENYMDYSSQLCQNSFTKGQSEIMRHTLENYRNNLFEVTSNIVDHNLEYNDFNLYPNPTENELTIQANSSILGVKIYDLNGRLMLAVSGLNGNETSLDLSSLTRGSYFIQISFFEGEGVRKFVKY